MQLAEKDIEIVTCKREIDDLNDRLKKSKDFDIDSKIRIVKGFKQTLIHLFFHLQEIELPDGRMLCKSQTKSALYKMISKYFQNEKKICLPIPYGITSLLKKRNR